MDRHTSYIGIGSNLGDRRGTILGAIEAIRAAPGILEVVPSSIHETLALGGPPGQGEYLNAAARVETTLSPHALLDVLLGIEARFGRVRGERWGPRTLDLDLLLYDQEVMDTPGLTVPHPRLHERLFVLEPLSEVAGGAVHPVLARTIGELLQQARSQGC